MAGSTWPSPPHLFATRPSTRPQAASRSSPRQVHAPSPQPQARSGKYVTYLLPPLPIGDDWAASVYPPESPSVSFSFSPSASASTSASPLASSSSISPLASRDKPLPEPPTSCSSPEPEYDRGPKESPDVVERHEADTDRDNVHNRDNVHDRDNVHVRDHGHQHKPSYDYGEYGYQFQHEYGNEWDTNDNDDPNEPPQPLEDYALPLAPFRQRENYDYALILAKELCTLTRDTSGLTVTSIHELREEIRRVLDSFAPSPPRSEACHGDHQRIARPKKDATLADLLHCAQLAKAAHRSVIAHFGELERGGPIDVDLLKEVDSSHFLRFVRAVNAELERMPPRWQLSRRLMSLREKASGWASDVWAVLEDLKADERWRAAQLHSNSKEGRGEPGDPDQERTRGLAGELPSAG